MQFLRPSLILVCGDFGIGLVWGSLLSRVDASRQAVRAILVGAIATIAIGVEILVFGSPGLLLWFAVGGTVSLVSHLEWRRQLWRTSARSHEEVRGD
jgi:uncharacterized membrane protein